MASQGENFSLSSFSIQDGMLMGPHFCRSHVGELHYCEFMSANRPPKPKKVPFHTPPPHSPALTVFCHFLPTHPQCFLSFRDSVHAVCVYMSCLELSTQQSLILNMLVVGESINIGRQVDSVFMW